jgi:Ca2+-binding EF-hand superfamily protein
MRLMSACLILLTLTACGRVAPVTATQVRAGKAAVRVVAPFRLFDLDDDGRISAGEALAANYGQQACAWTANQRREHILNLYYRVEAEHGDGLTEEEWLAGPATLQPIPPDSQTMEKLRDLFFDADTNSSGTLDRDELMAAKAYAPPGGWTKADRAAAITELLASVDYDRDHEVSFDETLWLTREVCAPTQVQTPSVSAQRR